MKVDKFTLPNGDDILLKDIDLVSAPMRDWKIYLRNIFKMTNPSLYFTITLRDGSTTERIYEDDELTRYRTLLFFLENTDTEDHGLH